MYTLYILSTYLQTTANAGFRGARRDEDILAGGPVSMQPHVTDDAEGDDNPCTEDEDFFQGRPDADDMEEVITKFLDGMEGQERSGFKDLHRFLGRLPLPVVKGGTEKIHTVRTALIQTRIGIQVLLFIHCTYIVHTPAFMFIHDTYIVHTRAYLFIYCTYIVHTKYLSAYIVHTWAFMFIHCTYKVHTRA